MEKVLITGSSGRIGKGLHARLREIFNENTIIHILVNTNPPPAVLGFCESKIVYDISESYDFVIHLAAITDTNFCKKPENRNAVLKTNVELTRKICDHAGHVLLVSTDNVFDGNSKPEFFELDEPRPCNFYGETKLVAEKIVIDKMGVVVRIQTMLGVDNRIVTAVIHTIQGQSHPPFWSNTYSRPSCLTDLVKVIKELYENQRRNIFHCSCAGDIFSRAQIAENVLEFFKKHDLPRAKDSIDQEECAIAFPRKLVLNSDLTQGLLNVSFTDTRRALNEHLLKTLLP